MIRHVHCIATMLLCLIGVTGCAVSRQADRPRDELTIFVPGVFGDGAWYDGLIDELRKSTSAVEVMTWGAPKATFAANFSDPKIHAEAEEKLAAKINELPPSVERVNLVGHSAGCGVILGGMARSGRNIQNVVLIAPSVSPQYDLTASLAKVESIDVFHSDRDTTFLKWRTGNFGTYDGIKTPAAGYAGFAATSPKLRQHAYDPAWKKLGNDGGHGGGVARAFVREIVSPLLRQGDQPR